MKTKIKPKYGMVSDEGRKWMLDILAEREEFVSTLVRGGWDFLDAMIKWDTERSPRMTQGDVLRRLGCLPDHSHASRKSRLRWIIDGLAEIHVYLTGTDHLTDDQLLDRLEIVLTDEVNFIPPNEHMSEFIDFNATGRNSKPVCNRDSTLPRPIGR